PAAFQKPAEDLVEGERERPVRCAAVAVLVRELVLAARLEDHREVGAAMPKLPAHAHVAAALESAQRDGTAQPVGDSQAPGIGGSIARVPDALAPALEVARNPHSEIGLPAQQAVPDVVGGREPAHAG